MTAGLAAMLVGLFVVPMLLLWAGHRMRRRAPAWRGAFWGALIGHVIAAVIAMGAAMYPPVAYAADDVLRGFLGFWLLLLGPALGAVAGALVRRRR